MTDQSPEIEAFVCQKKKKAIKKGLTKEAQW